MEPTVAYLGTSFQEAADLQVAHLEILQKLQSKQSPVEDLLRQADDLIVNQKTRADVYTAMAESLGRAWRDLTYLLDERKLILDQNYIFQGHYQVLYVQKAVKCGINIYLRNSFLVRSIFASYINNYQCGI